MAATSLAKKAAEKAHKLASALRGSKKEMVQKGIEIGQHIVSNGAAGLTGAAVQKWGPQKMSILGAPADGLIGHVGALGSIIFAPRKFAPWVTAFFTGIASAHSARTGAQAVANKQIAIPMVGPEGM